MLDLNDVSVTFHAGTVNERKALDHVSLHLDRGEFVCVLGTNGAGKSTLLNAVSGTLSADSGTITLDGMDLTRQPEHKRARYIGRLFQDPMKGTAPDMSIGLRDGESVERFRLRAQTLIAQLDQQDELLVLADLIGGSPLTTVLDVLQEKGMLTNTAVLGGMNLPMALNAVLCKDQGIREMKQMILQEATASISEMTLQNEEEEDI